MKCSYDVRVGHTDFKRGDRLWFYSKKKEVQSSKLQISWEGPYTAVEHPSDVTYRVNGGSMYDQVKTVHVNWLWRYCGPGTYTWGTPDRPEVNVDVMSSLPQDESSEGVNRGGGDLDLHQEHQDVDLQSSLIR